MLFALISIIIMTYFKCAIFKHCPAVQLYVFTLFMKPNNSEILIAFNIELDMSDT